MSILDRILGRKESNMTTTNDKIKALEGRKADVQKAQGERDDRLKSLKFERQSVELDAVAGDAAAQKHLSDIDAEASRIESLSADGARVLAEIGDELLVLRQQAKVEAEQAETAERQKQAKADLKRLPSMFTKVKSLRQELAAMQADLRAMGAIGVDLDAADLDAEEAVATEWLEWRAGLNDLDPVNAKMRSDYDALQRARAEREAFDRGRNQRENRRLDAAGWRPRGQAGTFHSEKWTDRHA